MPVVMKYKIDVKLPSGGVTSLESSKINDIILFINSEVKKNYWVDPVVNRRILARINDYKRESMLSRIIDFSQTRQQAKGPYIRKTTKKSQQTI